MLAIMERWEAAADLHTDNTTKFLLLIVGKAGLDTMFFCAFNKGWHRSFLGLCSLSIIVIDWLVALTMANVWFFVAAGISVSPCFILAHASAAYGALPLPMMCLGILDYCLDDTSVGRSRPMCKLLRNTFLLLVVWIQAGIHSARSADSQLTEYRYTTGGTLFLCTIEETHEITCMVTMIFSGVLLVIWPFYSGVFRLAQEREAEDNGKSDFFTSDSSTKTQVWEEKDVQKTKQPRLPMGCVQTMAFVVMWMPYLIMSVVCMFGDLTIPALISINNMWLECIHGVLVGVLFWAKGGTTGQYNDTPESICSWRIYWQLSRGTQPQKPVLGVFNPSNEKKTFFSLV